MRPVQYFSDEYLETCRRIPAEDVLEFLESFRLLHAPNRRSRLISMKIDEDLLAAFKLRCKAEGVRYQTRIKDLMRAWLVGDERPRDEPSRGV